jgi:hypothetical protein
VITVKNRFNHKMESQRSLEKFFRQFLFCINSSTNCPLAQEEKVDNTVDDR